VAAVLVELKQLEALEMDGSRLHVPDDVPRTEHALVIVQAVAGLSKLQSLGLVHVEFGRQAAMELSGLSQLTQLRLTCCGLVDYDVNVIAVQLTALQELAVGYNPHIADSVLPVIARNLRQLVSLQLMHTKVSDLGLQWLRQMPQLRKVGVCKRLTSSPALAGADLDVDDHACVVCLR
jgi:hypothetical protein